MLLNQVAEGRFSAIAASFNALNPPASGKRFSLVPGYGLLLASMSRLDWCEMPS